MSNWREQFYAIRRGTDTPQRVIHREATYVAWLEGRVYSNWPMHRDVELRKAEMRWHSVSLGVMFSRMQILKYIHGVAKQRD